MTVSVNASKTGLFDPSSVAITGGTIGGVKVRALSGAKPEASRPTMMLIGNSIARLQRRNGYGGGVYQVGGYGWLWWAMSYLGQPMQFVLTGDETQIGSSANSTMCDGIYGFSGGTSVDILGQMPTVLSGRTPDYIFLHMMENDPIAVGAGSLTTTQASAAYRSAISMAQQCGSTVVWIGCLPSSDFDTAGERAAYWALQQAAQAACADLGAIYVQTWDLYTDASSTNPIPLNSGSFANMVFTNVHPMRAGILIGRRVADVLSNLGLNSTIVTGMVAPSSARFVGGNALCSGTGGLVNTFSGSAPANAQVTHGLASTTTLTSALTVDGGQQIWDIVTVAGAQTGIVTAIQVYNASGSGGYTTGWSVGDLVQTYIDIEFLSTSPMTGVRTVEVQTSFVGGTPSSAFVNSQTTADDANMPFVAGRRMRIATPVVAVPPGTTGLRPFAKVMAAKDAAAVDIAVRVRGFGVINWSV